MSRSGGKRAAAGEDAFSASSKRARTDTDGSDAEAPAAAEAALAEQRHQRLLLARPSIAQMAPQDAISHMLSLLDCRDFAAAAQTCRQWRVASVRASSWSICPTRGHPWGGPGSRKFIPVAAGRVLHVPLLHAFESAHYIPQPCYRLEALLKEPVHALMRTSIRAVDVRMGSLVQSMREQTWRGLARRTLAQIAEFSKLEAVRLPADVPFSEEDLEQFFRAVSQRLVSLAVDEPIMRTFRVGSSLSLLSNLRALSVAINVDVDALLQLRALERLTLCVPHHQPAEWGLHLQCILRAARILSVQASLRSLELRSFPDTSNLSVLFDALEESPALAPAALQSLAMGSQVAATSIVGVMQLAHLTALRLDVAQDALATMARGMALLTPTEPSSVTELQLFTGDYQSSETSLSEADLASLAARFARVRMLHVNPSAVELLCVSTHFLARLRELRELTMSWRGRLPYELMWALSFLPHFRSLLVEYDADDSHSARMSLMPMRIDASALRLIAKSATWRTLHLRGGMKLRTELLLEPLKPASLSALQDFRIIEADRQLAHSRVSLLQQVAGAAAGVVAWQPVEGAQRP